MNKVILVGRLVREPEVKTTQGNIEVCSYVIAVDRRFKAANGERQSDFISCVAWRQLATLLGKYCHKGDRIGITGNLQARSYDDANGKKVYVTEVIVDEIEFLETTKRSGSAPAGTAPAAEPVPSLEDTNTGFYPDYDDDTHLPFDL